MQTLLWAILPLAGALITWLLPLRWGKTIPAWATLAALCGFSYTYAVQDFSDTFGWQWASQIAFRWAADGTAVTMMLMVNAVSFAVQVYSWGYMRHEQRQRDYFALLGLFTFAMNMLIISADLLSLFFFWEIVGFCSWALIGFWREKAPAGMAANKAFLINRLADLGFLAALGGMWAAYGSFDLAVLGNGSEFSKWHWLIGAGLLLAAMGKSAQLPFSVWLPDAMQGPTPVSALMHAATMVVSGIYLLIRIFPALGADIQLIAAGVGSLTALVGAAAAATQYDLKRILAYSTISQLGLMLAAVGAGDPDAAFLHLLSHGFYKAALFLCAGIVIHVAHTQDIRQMGGMRQQRFLFVVFTLAAAGLAGVPLTAGFLTKETVLYANLTGLQDPSGLFGLICFLMLLVASLGTAFYTARMWFLVFYSQKRNDIDYQEVKIATSERVALSALAIFIPFIAFSLLPFSWSASLLTFQISLPQEATPLWLALLSLALLVGGAGFAWRIYCCRTNILQQDESLAKLPGWRTAYNFLYLDTLYHKLWQNSGTAFAQFLAWSKRSAPVPEPKIWLEGGKYLTVSAISRWLEQKSLPTLVAGSRRIAAWEQALLDRPIDLLAKATVVIGHVQAWIDRTIVDGAVKGIYQIIGIMGKRIRTMQSGKVQSYYIGALLFCLLLLLFLLMSCEPVNRERGEISETARAEVIPPDLTSVVKDFTDNRAILLAQIETLAQDTDSTLQTLPPPETTDEPAATDDTPVNNPPANSAESLKSPLERKVDEWEREWEDLLMRYEQMRISLRTMANSRDYYFEQMNRQTAQISDSRLRKTEFKRNSQALAAFNRSYRQWYRELGDIRQRLYRGRDIRLLMHTAVIREQFDNEALGNVRRYIAETRNLLQETDSLLRAGNDIATGKSN
ncbi:NADH-quinone oxidoreductase subunit 5 family protein [Rhodoflexus sp.]